MSELFLAYRDGVGINSTVVLDDNPTLIKDLPPKQYDLYHQENMIGEKMSPNQIPGFLLHYCTQLVSEGFKFEGKSIYNMISNLEIIALSRES